MKTEAFCWWCQEPLRPKKGGGYHYRLVQGMDGELHRVHAACLDDDMRLIGYRVYEPKEEKLCSST